MDTSGGIVKAPPKKINKLMWTCQLTPFPNSPEVLADALDEVLIMRYHHHPAAEALHRLHERVPRLDVEVVRGLIQQYQMGDVPLVGGHGGRKNAERGAGLDYKNKK